jgi:hypothetical protein
MDEKIVDEILDELFSSFEKSETDSVAILLLLKERGIASQEKLAPFIEEASRMSEVRWRAARVRMSALLKSAMKTPEQPAEQKTTASRDQERKQTEEKEEKKEPAEMNQREDKKETQKKDPEKNPEPKADAEPATGSEKTATPKSEDSKTAQKSNKPAAGETESSRDNSRSKAEVSAKEAKAVPPKPTKRPDLPEKAEKNKYSDG